MAVDTVLGGPYAINDVAARSASTADVTYLGVLKGRSRSGAEVAAVVVGGGRDRARGACPASPPDARVPWGLGMRTPSFVTARLMETWAHGLDVRAALGVAAVDTDRLAHVAWLATRALPYAYTVAGREPPADAAAGRADAALGRDLDERAGRCDRPHIGHSGRLLPGIRAAASLCRYQSRDRRSHGSRRDLGRRERSSDP